MTAGHPPATPPGSEERARLEVSDLEVRIGTAGPDVVSEIGFAVPAGEVLGLVGESGSGKTTVALALLGHARRGLRITGGEVLLDGTDLLRLSPGGLRAARGAKVAYVPQDPSAALNPGQRVGTQLREALQVHPGVTGDQDGRVLEVLREARLDATHELLRRYPHQLSGGQQQRVSLAMAFCCRPSLIVLDEPTTGLDVSTQRHVLETVRSLCRSYGVAAVYVSHDLAVVGGLVSEVAVMYAGRIIEIGPTAKVFGEPLHPYTRGLLAAVPSPLRAEVLTGIEGQPPRPGRRGPGCSFATRIHRTSRLSMSVGTGGRARHSPIAKLHRAANEHPGPRRPGRGGWPSIPVSTSARSGDGTAASSPRVYGCNGSPNTFAVGPISTMRPAYMTATSATSPPTTARSWLT